MFKYSWKLSGKRTHIFQEYALVSGYQLDLGVSFSIHIKALSHDSNMIFLWQKRKTGPVLHLKKYFSIILWKTGGI